MSQSKPAAEASSFEMDVQEDIAAELEAFILRSRLGLWEEANEILDKALWRHLNFFPVFAEVAVYLVERSDYQRYIQLRLKISEENLVFAKNEEKDFVKSFITSYRSVGLELLGDSGIRPKISGSDKRSPIQIQKRQIQMTALVRNLLWHLGTSQVHVAISTISSECDFLISEGFVWEASRMFALACQLAFEKAMYVFDKHPGSYSDRNLMRQTQDDLSARYEELMLLVEDDLLLKANDIDEKAGELLTSVHAKMSFIKMLWADQKQRSTFMLTRRFRYKYDFSEIYKAATERLRMVFQLLPDPSMRGEYADNLRSSRPANPHPIVKALDQSTIWPRPAKPDNPKLSQEPRKSKQPSTWLANRSDQSENLDILDEASERLRKALSKPMSPTGSPKALHGIELPYSYRIPSGELLGYTLPSQSTPEAATMGWLHPEQEQNRPQKRAISNDPGKPRPLPKPSEDAGVIPSFEVSDVEGFDQDLFLDLLRLEEHRKDAVKKEQEEYGRDEAGLGLHKDFL